MRKHISQSIEGESFPDFGMLDARIASAFEKDHLHYFFQKEGQC